MDSIWLVLCSYTISDEIPDLIHVNGLRVTDKSKLPKNEMSVRFELWLDIKNVTPAFNNVLKYLND